MILHCADPLPGLGQAQHQFDEIPARGLQSAGSENAGGTHNQGVVDVVSILVEPEEAYACFGIAQGSGYRLTFDAELGAVVNSGCGANSSKATIDHL